MAEIAAKAGLSAVPHWGGPLNQIISGLQQRRNHVAEHALGAISERVGWDAFLSVVEGNPEVEAMLWTALQAITMTGMESKRKVLQNVVANAMTSDEPIDLEQVKVTVLAELDAPHIRALTRLSEADWLDKKEANRRDHGESPHKYVEEVAKREPVPVLAALIRTGVVFPGGSVLTADGLAQVPSAGELAVSGVTDFGDELLYDLCTQDGGAPPPHLVDSAKNRAFRQDLERRFRARGHK
jgi:hypothetical protein